MSHTHTRTTTFIHTSEAIGIRHRPSAYQATYLQNTPSATMGCGGSTTKLNAEHIQKTTQAQTGVQIAIKDIHYW